MPARTDSLLTLLSVHKPNDTRKVDLLNEVALSPYIADQANIDTALNKQYLRYAEGAAGLSLKLDYSEGLARAYNISGIIDMYAGRFYSAFSSYKKAESLYTTLNDTLRLGYVYNNMVMILSMVHDKDNELEYARKLLDAGLSCKDTRLVLTAVLHLFIAGYSDARAIEGMKLVVHSDRISPQHSMYVEMLYGMLLVEHQCSPEGLGLLNKARLFYEKDTLATYLHDVYLWLAHTHIFMEHADSAVYYMGKAEQLPVKEDIKGMHFKETIYARIDSLHGDYLGALEHTQTAMRLKDEIDVKYKTQDITRIKNWAEFEQQEKANQILLQEKQTQRHLIYLLSFLLVLVIVLSTLLMVYYRRRISDHRLLRETNAELKEMHDVKDKLFSLVAHDLRSPIATLSSFLNVISHTQMDPEAQQQMFRELSRKVDETFMLLNNLLQWSKTQMKGICPEPVFFDILEGSRRITDQLAGPATDKGILLQNDITEQQVYCDQNMFDVILRNLVTNAIKFTHPDDCIRISSRLSGDFVEISVADNGIGIPEDLQRKLFRLDGTVTRPGTASENGTGLGLILCDDFIRRNDGKLWFNSRMNKGSTFFFTIPVRKD